MVNEPKAEFSTKPKTAIWKMVSLYRKSKRILCKASTGRPKTTTKRVYTGIIQISDSDMFESIPKIRSQLLKEGKTALSTSTIRRRLHENQKHGRIAKKIPYLSAKP